MFKVVTLVVASLLMFGCAKGPKSTQEIFDIGSRSAVRVLSLEGRPHGSGFVTKTGSGHNAIVTNEHVCYGASSYRLQLVGIGEIEVVLPPTLTDVEHDLCVFALPAELQDILVPLPIANTYKLRTKVYAIGYPLQYNLSLSEGFSIGRITAKIASLNRSCPNPIMSFFGLICVQEEDLVSTNTVIYPGNSGSMALNDQAEVVGVFNSAAMDTNYGNMVPLEYLKAFLKDL